MSLYDKEVFKNNLRAKGYINFSDDEIDSMFNEYQSDYGGLIQNIVPDQNTNPIISPSQDVYPDIFGGGPGYVPQGEGGSLGQFVGATAWEFANTALFGLPGVVDYNDYIENFMVYGDATPTVEECTLTQGTMAESWGRGIGGLAGFMVPWGPWAAGTKLAGKAAQKFSRFGTEKVVQNLTKAGDGSIDAYLTSIRPSRWGKLTQGQKDNAFKDLGQEVKDLSIWLASGEKKETWAKAFITNSRDIVKESLRRNNIRLTDKQMDNLMDLTHKTLGTHKATGPLPVTKLQEWIARSLQYYGKGTKLEGTGFNKIAEAVGHGFEEGAIFATVDTWLHSMRILEGKATAEEIPHVMGHAFLLGNALAGIRMLPGGKTQGNISPAVKKLNQWFNDKKTFAYDVTSKGERKSLGRMAISFMESGGGKLLNEKAPKEFKGIISSVDDIKNLLKGEFTDPIRNKKLTSEEGAELLQKILNGFHKDWNKWWRKEWMSEFGKDMFQSSHRMLLGGLVNTTGVLFDENTPFHDKIFAFGVGAFITQKGREFKYTDAKTGEVKIWAPTDRPLTFNPKFEKVNKLLDFIGDRDVASNRLFMSMLQEERLKTNYIKAEETPDIKTLVKLMEKDYTVDGEKELSPVSKPANAANHPIYQYISQVFPLMAKDGKRLKDITELTEKEVSSIERKLAETDFKDVIAGKGIEFESDIDDILITSNRKAWDSVTETYINAVVRMYNDLTGSGVTHVKGQKEPIDLTEIRFSGDLKGDRYDTFLHYDAGLKTLKRLGYVNVSRRLNNNHLQIDPAKLDVVKKTMDVVDKELNTKWYQGKELLDQSKMVRFGDGISTTFLKSQGFYHSLNHTHRLLWNLDKDNTNWLTREGSKRTDGELLSDIINRLFKSNSQLLFDDIIVKGRTGDKGELERLNRMVNAFRMVLQDHPNTRNPFIDGTAGTHEISIKDARELRKLLRDNRLNGFMLGDIDLAQFVSSFRRLALDRKLKGSAKIVNGKPMPLLGRDRSIIQFFLESGIVKANNFEYADVVRVMESVAALPQINQAIGGFRVSPTTVMYTLKGDYKLDLITNPELKSTVKKAAENAGVTPDAFLKDMLTLWKNYAEPYLSDGKGNGLFKMSAVSEVDPGVLFKLVNTLKMVEKNDIFVTHQQLIETTQRLRNHKEWTDPERALLNTIMGRFFNHGSDTVQLLQVLGKTGLYIPEKGQFNFEYKDVTARIKEAQALMNFIQPQGMVESMLKQRINEHLALSEKVSESDIFSSITYADFQKKYNITDEWTWIDSYDKPVAVVKDLVERAAKKVDGDWVNFHDLKEAKDKRVIIDEAIQVYKNLIGQRKFQRLSAAQGFGVLAKETTMADNSLFRTLDTIIGEGSYHIVDTKFLTKLGSQDVFRDKDAMRELIKSLDGNHTQTDASMRIDDLDLSNPVVKTLGSHYVTFFGDMSWGIAVPKGQASKIAETFVKWHNKKKKQYAGNKRLAHLKEIIDAKVEIIEKPRIDEKTGEIIEGKKDYEYNFKASTAEADGIYLEAMLNYMYMDKTLNKSWWNHLDVTFNGKDPLQVSKLLRRVRMLANVGGVESTRSLRDLTEGLYKDFKIEPEVVSALKELREKNFNGIVLQDEVFTLGGRQMSLLKDAMDQIKKESDVNKDWLFDQIAENTNTGELEFNKTKASSLTD